MYPNVWRAALRTLFRGGMRKRPVLRFNTTGKLSSRFCSSGVMSIYATAWPVASVLPRRSTSEPDQAPAATMTTSALRTSESLNFAPMTRSPSVTSSVTLPLTNWIRPVA
ncbi:hypothetical protein FOXG_18511 [Fusarium oxysporum f. sp. lycopersici 4287]|uniref:Uncharacterized protein n=1 Tax=Fusarium oxysporum f. sp. lycopersici (strain 4287 / CBS 123668 / FGSC 9935 / NRRL 34936) TaxID=426428 RepID=A0A0J9UIA9_FUSO4|nr:hypothetical protein FOXG_18511 [Fusarium oxysporum f. sp. lycopersici 4287]KAI8408502.1 hypothetical protein FOFC_11447 [Fusarium oxysporum]KNA99158.1 hypothetical protein FOXG_18511 [Fusarium oxysporum f. sp. lycopersici 4287]